MKSLVYLAAFMILTVCSGSALANCSDGDLGQVKENIAWCGRQCGSSGHQRECNGNGYMGTHAKSGDPNGVREALNSVTEAEAKLDKCKRAFANVRAISCVLRVRYMAA